MNADEGISLVWGIGALVLVVSSLAARQLPIGKTVKMVLAWIAIFGGMFVLFLFKDEGRVVWDRATAELSGNAGQIEGTTLRIPREEDGHYWVRANVNGTPVRFMVDSGATTTTLSPAAARTSKIEPSGGFPVLVETANGTVEVQRARIKTLAVGNIVQRDAAVLIGSEGLGDTNLLGMSFLSALKSWRVEGSTLILEP
jgi:aspartyl protease family protein